VEYLRGDPSKAKRQLGWEPKVSFHGLVRMMVETDFKELEDEGAKRDFSSFC
jgi:GDPmannose 4,6-dehydratase